ncbi:hypothetical protein [Afipia sp. GAS231]|uniref:hypothetical protein n=1 Tax=Afipia sp. GAS231 TaxID=1882747 RepID=UPI00087C11D5|nr:hypothetical protein [Afipia sp. GAS231]SDN74928.1 hypothetical protein SAMN05444050_2325 [Afipia sp. GAS231]
MDGRRLSISPITRCGQIDAEAAPIDAVRETSSITYSGSAQRISEGFVIALRAMGFEAGMPPSDMAQSDATPDPEDS